MQSHENYWSVIYLCAAVLPGDGSCALARTSDQQSAHRTTGLGSHEHRLTNGGLMQTKSCSESYGLYIPDNPIMYYSHIRPIMQYLRVYYGSYCRCPSHLIIVFTQPPHLQRYFVAHSDPFGFGRRAPGYSRRSPGVHDADRLGHVRTS